MNDLEFMKFMVNNLKDLNNVMEELLDYYKHNINQDNVIYSNLDDYQIEYRFDDKTKLCYMRILLNNYIVLDFILSLQVLQNYISYLNDFVYNNRYFNFILYSDIHNTIYCSTVNIDSKDYLLFSIANTANISDRMDLIKIYVSEEDRDVCNFVMDIEFVYDLFSHTDNYTTY